MLKKSILLFLLLISPMITMAQTVEIRVINRCPFPLWSHAFAYKLFTPTVQPIDSGASRLLNTGDSIIYSNLPPIGGGRLYAYYKEPPAGAKSLYAPVSTYNQFVEMTLESGRANYNISYVDHAALPVSVKGKGNCPITSSCVSSELWKQKLLSCPTEVTNKYNGLGTCLASYDYCLEYPNSDYCTKMEVYGGGRFTGAQIYGGTMGFPSENVKAWDSVAAWNRGAEAGDPDPSHYFLGPQKVGTEWVKPYNEYAAWIHKDIGAEVYSFSTDDHQDQSGFQACIGSTVMEVVWCPCECTLAIQNTNVVAPSCSNNDGQITVVASGATGAVEYSKDGLDFSASATFSNLAAGSYTLYVKDVMLCIDSITVVLPKKNDCACSRFAGSMLKDIVQVCSGSVTQTAPSSSPVMGVNDALLYYLHSGGSNSLGTVYAISNTPSFSFVSGMQTDNTYYISAVVGNINGNQIDLSDTCISIAPGTPVIFNALPDNANAGENDTFCGANYQLKANQPLVGQGTWTIVSGDGNIVQNHLPNSFVQNLSSNANCLLRWTVSNGVCDDNSSEVHINTQCSSFVLNWPNVISPNNDGVNDVFKALYVDDSNFQKVVSNMGFITFTVVNRWGNLIYFSDDNVLPFWDATFNGQQVASGTYYYNIQYLVEGIPYDIKDYILILN